MAAQNLRFGLGASVMIPGTWDSGVDLASEDGAPYEVPRRIFGILI